MGNRLSQGCISEATAVRLAGNYPSMTFAPNTGDSSCFTYCPASFAYVGWRSTVTPGSQTNGFQCYCFNDNLTPADTVRGANSGGDCVVGDIEYRQRTTTFRYPDCHDVPATLPAGATTFATIPECLFYCRGAAYANYIPDSATNSYQCYCSSNRPSNPYATCGANVAFNLFHENYPQSSGMARKRSERLSESLRRRRLGKGGDQEYCPAGLSACNIGGRASGYECIDTSSELESCGGCTHGLYGLVAPAEDFTSADCTTMSGVPFGGSTCEKGKCVAMACEDGFYLHRGECLPELD